MTRPIIRYEAGHQEAQQFVVALDIIDISSDKARLVSRFIEFWCQRNSRGRWRVEERARVIEISFASQRDMVLFKMSEEYNDHEGRWHRVDTTPSFLSLFRTDRAARSVRAPRPF